MAQTQAVALSKNDTFDFLRGSKHAAEQLTPLEREAIKVQSFASYTTGAIEMKITPEMMTFAEGLKDLTLSTEFKKLAHFVQTLQRDLPVQNNLLVVILNPAWLASSVPFCDTPADITEEQLKKAQWPIELSGDYALIDGVPVWERLEGERLDFYNLFKLYRDARYGLLDTGDYILCNRSMAGLARKLNISPALVSTISKIYNWATRCAYYDKYFEMEVARRRQMEVQILQQDHLKFATTLVDKAMSFFEKKADQITPKDAIAMAELGFKISRLSLGLAPDKPVSGGNQASQPLLAIYNNTTTNQADKMIQVNDQRSYGSEVERRLQENLKDNTNLLSILHVLQKSGAMSTALHSELVSDKSDEPTFESDTVEEPAAVSVVNIQAQPTYVEPIQKPPAAFEEGI
jgi:hypothetical protein